MYPIIKYLANYDMYNYNVPKRALLGLSAGLAIFMVIAGLIMLGSLIFWLMMLVDAVNRDFKDKPLWILVLLVSLVTGLWLIGALVYYFAVKKTIDTKPARKAKPPTKTAKKT